MARLDQHRHGSGLRRQLAQQAEPLRRQLCRQGGDAGGVAAGAIEAADEAQLDRRVRHQKVDRSGRGRRLGRGRRRGAGQRRDHRDPLADQIRSQFRQPLVLALGPAEFDRDVQGLTGPALSASVGADVPR